ncbi:MAG: hypothetical protein PHQ43_08575 [Dehalococcoidales bacterium]|nr:hypothetical protein [Dehalococcoidales bacterium]
MGIKKMVMGSIISRIFGVIGCCLIAGGVGAGISVLIAVGVVLFGIALFIFR